MTAYGPGLRGNGRLSAYCVRGSVSGDAFASALHPIVLHGHVGGDVNPVMRMVSFLFAAGAIGVVWAQAPQRFEVAWVKQHVGALTSGASQISGARITITGFSEGGLLYLAYGIRISDIANPESLEHTYYDIEADAGDGRKRTMAEFRPMLQSLLADRFQLAIHQEKRPTPVYEMVLDKSGFRGKPSDIDSADDRPHVTGVAHSANTILTWKHATIVALATYLHDSDGLDRRVIDKTGLTGKYDLTMTYVPPVRLRGAMPDGAEDIDVFTAMRTQLGLRLERATEPVELWVIDHWQKPGAN